jgi:hypothetical protein
MSTNDRIPRDQASSRHVAPMISPAEPSETQHSSQIDGNKHLADHHLGVSWNPRTTTLFAGPAGPHAAYQLQGKLVVEEKHPTPTAACRPQSSKASHRLHDGSPLEKLMPRPPPPHPGHTTHGPCRATEGAPPPRHLQQMGRRHRCRHHWQRRP